MVRSASEGEAKAWGALPSKADMGLRRISSVLLMGGLLCIITPFAPFTWIFATEYEYTYGHVLDLFLSVPILMGAVWFQWVISGIVAPLAIEIIGVGFVYSHKMYWHLAAIETVVLMAVQLGRHEIARRFASVGLVGGLWAIGWSATPERYKREAWEHLKWLFIYMAFDQATSMVRGRRRRW